PLRTGALSAVVGDDLPPLADVRPRRLRARHHLGGVQPHVSGIPLAVGRPGRADRRYGLPALRAGGPRASETSQATASATAAGGWPPGSDALSRRSAHRRARSTCARAAATTFSTVNPNFFWS